MRRLIALVLLGYVSLDFALPGMPGALSFELAQSVDAVRSPVNAAAAAVKDVDVSSLPLVGAALAITTPSASRARTTSLRRRPLADGRARALLPRVSIPASSDDHSPDPFAFASAIRQRHAPEMPGAWQSGDVDTVTKRGAV
jgi:hypothetical protein